MNSEVIFEKALKLAKQLKEWRISFRAWRRLLRKKIKSAPHLDPWLHELLLALEPDKPEIRCLVEARLLPWIDVRDIGWHETSVQSRVDALVEVALECAWRDLPRIVDYYTERRPKEIEIEARTSAKTRAGDDYKAQAKLEFRDQYDERIRELVELVVNALTLQVEEFVKNDGEYGRPFLERHLQRLRPSRSARREAKAIRRALEKAHREAEKVRRALNRIFRRMLDRIVKATMFWPTPMGDTP